MVRCIHSFILLGVVASGGSITDNMTGTPRTGLKGGIPHDDFRPRIILGRCLRVASSLAI